MYDKMKTMALNLNKTYQQKEKSQEKAQESETGLFIHSGIS